MHGPSRSLARRPFLSTVPVFDPLPSPAHHTMPKTFENGFALPYQWSQAALAVWHKYPNPFAPHVVSMDVVDRTYDERTGLLRVERILGVRQGAPTWAVKVRMSGM